MLTGNFFPRVCIPNSWKYTIHYKKYLKKKQITVTFVKDLSKLCFMNALLSVIITSRIFLFRKRIQSFQIDEFVKSFSIIYICLTTQLLYQKNEFYTCSRLIFMLRMLCWRKYSVIFSILDIIWNRSKRATFMGSLVFPSKIFLELSNFLMLKTQLAKKHRFMRQL